MAAGKESVMSADWVTRAEDSSYSGENTPSFYFFVGGMPRGKDRSEAAPHHTPDFYIDDSRPDVGVTAFAHIVFDFAR